MQSTPARDKITLDDQSLGIKRITEPAGIPRDPLLEDARRVVGKDRVCPGKLGYVREILAFLLHDLHKVAGEGRGTQGWLPGISF